MQSPRRRLLPPCGETLFFREVTGIVPLLSVIVPVHNSEKYLSRCIDSILSQTFTDFELLLVNDGSTDKSRRICDEYAKQNSKIRVLHKNENSGPLHTRKLGFENACGEYISYIDSDDYIDSAMYETMMKPIVQYKTDIVICGIFMETETKRIPLYFGAKEGLYDKKRLTEQIYPYMLYSPKRGLPLLSPSLCNKIFRKEILRKALCETDNKIYYGEDAVCSYPSILDAESIYMLPQNYLYIYCKTEESLTNMYDKRLFSKLPILIDTLDKAFSSRGFDGKNQVDFYAAIQLLEAVRKELLFNFALSPAQRIKKVRDYIRTPRLAEALYSVRHKKINRKIGYKLYLLRTGQIALLYFQFQIKNILCNRKNRKER